MKVPFNNLKTQYETLKPEMDAAIQSVIDRTAFVNGPDIAQFEAAFGAFCGGGECAGVANGTDGVELALRACDIGPGDEVILPAMTFIATAEPVHLMGAVPVLVDVDAKTYNIDVGAIEAAITPKTKAIIAVHLYGQPADMDPINAIAAKHGLKVIEDAAQAHGAEYKGRRVGILGNIASFSFFPGKNLGAYGDGGAVVSRNPDMVDTVRRYRDHGRLPQEKFGHRIIGRNSRLDTIQAAVLSVKLPYLDGWNARRREIAAIYDERLSGLVELPHNLADVTPVYHLYVIQTDNRDDLRAKLGEMNVASGTHYPEPIHLHEGMLNHYDYAKGQFLNAESMAKRILSLPVFPDMSLDQTHYVCDCIKSIFEG